MTLDANKAAEIRTAEESLRRAEPHLFRKPFAPEWGTEPWIKWATITEAFARLGVRPPHEVLDLGCGEGWTTLFLAEAGYDVLGLDLAPARIGMAEDRAGRWNSEASFAVDDMETFDLGRTFDAVLVYDALHHTRRQTSVIANVARHLRPGGWVLFGEPSWLHGISPHARRTERELGWVERGITARSLRLDCGKAGLGEFRRFFEPTRPYSSRVREALVQLARLSTANIAVAPQASIWLGARRPSA
jgi:2-polyprenyl-3-methyl-5-hydroxy-6-metoxy-1,4-benzoquinol methylase